MPTCYTVIRDRLLVCSHAGATDESVISSDDAVFAGEWNTRTRLEGKHLECVGVSPDAPERVFVGSFEDGLFRSSDGGETFESLETPFVSDSVMALTVSPHDPAVVYAGTEPSRVYRSTDGGESWTHLEGLVDVPSAEEWYFPPRPDTHHVRWLEVDPFDPTRVYVGIEAGALVLRDEDRETWHERPAGSRIDNHTLATHPDREGRVYSAAGDGYAQSDDSGETWHHPQTGLEHTYCWSVVPAREDPDTVLLSSASGAQSAHNRSHAEAYVYRKRGDEAWKRLDDRGLPMGEGVVRSLLAVDESGVVYAVTNRGLFASCDVGDSWHALECACQTALESTTPRGLAVV